MSTRAMKTTRIAAATLAAVAIGAPTALIAAGSYNTRADVRTMSPKSVTKSTAKVGAMVAPNGVAVTVNLKITPSGGKARTVRLGAVGARVPMKTIWTTVTGLKKGTRYKVQAVAVNGGKKTSPGTTVSFTTKR